jgi:hypothetical protein
MKEIRILGVHITERVEKVTDVQSALTKFGCSIRTRLGLHELHDGFCSPGGIIILEMTGSAEEAMKLENELLRIDGVDVKKMVFEE